jgi:hypothetical protein
MNQPSAVSKPSRLVVIFNRLFGWFVGLGLAPAHYYLLQVRGRKSGRLFSTPVDVLDLRGKRFLVAPRGYTQWVRNAQASGTIALKRGRTVAALVIREVADPDKPEILKAYLDTFKLQVQRFFPVSAGSLREAFIPLASRYPVFELVSPQ